jgi:hypothetical protein
MRSRSFPLVSGGGAPWTRRVPRRFLHCVLAAAQMLIECGDGDINIGKRERGTDEERGKHHGNTHTRLGTTAFEPWEDGHSNIGATERNEFQCLRGTAGRRGGSAVSATAVNRGRGDCGGDLRVFPIPPRGEAPCLDLDIEGVLCGREWHRRVPPLRRRCHKLGRRVGVDGIVPRILL